MIHPRMIHRFFCWSHDERKLFFQAAALLVFVRTALVLVRFRTLWEFLERAGLVAKRAPQTQCLVPVSEPIALALTRAGRNLPGTTCLTRALAGTVMLSRQGYPATLCIGVAKEDTEFGAHAWVECDGRPVVGSKEHFKTLLVLPRDSLRAAEPIVVSDTEESLAMRIMSAARTE